MRVLGVDYGRVRVGLALSDPLGRTAQPLAVVQRPKRGSLVDEVVAVAKREGAERIVVGLPLKLDGTEGIAAEATRQFARALEQRAALPVVLWDERLSTREASRGMRDAGIDARHQRGTIDKIAAAIVLRAYLESEIGAPPEPSMPGPPDRSRHPRDEIGPEPRPHRSRKSARRSAGRRGRHRDE